jgi:hypothetical protein
VAERDRAVLPRRVARRRREPDRAPGHHDPRLGRRAPSSRSPTTCCGCRSASRRSTTSSPTSTGRSADAGGPRPPQGAARPVCPGGVRPARRVHTCPGRYRGQARRHRVVGDVTRGRVDDEAEATAVAARASRGVRRSRCCHGCGPDRDARAAHDLAELSAAAPRSVGRLRRRRGQLAVLRQEFRRPVTLGSVPRHLVDAVLVAEDRRFFDHGGVDARPITCGRRSATSPSATSSRAGRRSPSSWSRRSTCPTPSAPPDQAAGGAARPRARAAHGQGRDPRGVPQRRLLRRGRLRRRGRAWTYFRKRRGRPRVAESALLAAIIRAPDALGPPASPRPR